MWVNAVVFYGISAKCNLYCIFLSQTASQKAKDLEIEGDLAKHVSQNCLPQRDQCIVTQVNFFSPASQVALQGGSKIEGDSLAAAALCLPLWRRSGTGRDGRARERGGESLGKGFQCRYDFSCFLLLLLLTLLCLYKRMSMM